MPVDDDYVRSTPSPGGTYRLTLTAIEAMNSQWVENGKVLRQADGALVVEIGEWNWHVDHASWLADDRLTVALRRFPGDAGGLMLTLELDAGFAHGSAESGGDADHVPFALLSEWLENWYLRERAKVQRR